MNKENYQKVLDQIIAHPKTWDQRAWHCGTEHCFAGWAQVLSGQPVSVVNVRRDARVYLDISAYEAAWLFGAARTLDELKAYNQKDPFQHGYNQDGYDRRGYNREGYDRQGYDSNGYDRDGLDNMNLPKKEG